jgi:hypothetical protein
MLVYTPHITNRCKYIFQVVFETVLKLPFELTNDVHLFESHLGPKINYSNRKFDEEFFIKKHDLLDQIGILDQDIHFSQWNGLPIFFKTSEEPIPFDIFSASFYLVSRYEEYLPHIKDHYNRFTAKESLAYKNNFLDKPLINLWLQAFQKQLNLSFPSLNFPHQKFTYLSTIDVDNAYYFLEKGFVRTVASFVKSVFQLDKEMIHYRKNVLLGKKDDPYDTFELQLELNKKYQVEVMYFVLLADYGLNDKNNSVYSRKFQLLIKHLADHAQIGIHPSFASNFNFETLKMEKNRLENIVNKEVFHSRQHFLKLELPKTYRNLNELLVEHDYSMGYASMPGFRASICTPFYFYDLELEKMTHLMVHPFCVMDATFNFYLKYRPEKSLETIKHFVDQVKSVNGQFVSLWHNEAWSDYKEWKGWKHLYQNMIDYIQN